MLVPECSFPNFLDYSLIMLEFILELQIPVVNYIFRESLKRKASDAEAVSLSLLSFKFLTLDILV